MSETDSEVLVSIATALGDGGPVLHRVAIRERISLPFEIEAELSSTSGELDHDRLVGSEVTLRLDRGELGPRYFSGLISRFVQAGDQGPRTRYQATIVPWFWFLGRTSDCRVFQRLSVLEIAEEVFAGNRFGSDFFESRLGTALSKRRYCVQYRWAIWGGVPPETEGSGTAWR